MNTLPLPMMITLLKLHHGVADLNDGELKCAEDLVLHGLIDRRWHLTERGRAFVDALLATRLPEKQLRMVPREAWVVPGSTDDQRFLRASIGGVGLMAGTVVSEAAGIANPVGDIATQVREANARLAGQLDLAGLAARDQEGR